MKAIAGPMMMVWGAGTSLARSKADYPTSVSLMRGGGLPGAQ